MSPTVDESLADHDLPVFMLPDGKVLPSTDIYGRPIAGFSGLAVGTGPDGEIVIMPSDWSGIDTGVEWTPLPGVVHNGAAVADAPLAAAGEATTVVAVPVPADSSGELFTVVFVSVAVLAIVVAVVLGVVSWRRARCS